MNNNKSILFIVYPTISHYISFLPIASRYKSRGYAVYLSGRNSYEKYINNMGYKYLDFMYYESYNIFNIKNAIILFIKNFSVRFAKTRYRDFLFFRNCMIKQIIDTGVDEICLDAHLAFYFIFIPKHIKTSIINSKLSTTRCKSVPPLSSGIVYRHNLMFSALSNILWIEKYITNFIAIAMKKIIFHGRDDKLFISKILRKNGLAFNDIFISSYKACFYYELNLNKTKVKSFILGAKQIEYEWAKVNIFERYILLDIHIIFQNETLWKDLYLFIASFKGLAKRKVTKLIYCSFGTITKRYEKKVVGFIQKLGRCFEEKDEYMLIISTGGVKIDLFEKHANIFMKELLPQHNILSICDLAITHGGMNSIKECLYFKTPMLVYPLNLQFDQPGNAARVEHFGLGLKGSMKRDTPKKIGAKVERILAWTNNQIKRE
jgi:zeaxanthin glucosyltransferase